MNNILIKIFLSLLITCINPLLKAKDITLEDIYIHKSYNPKLIKWQNSQKNGDYFYMLDKGTDIIKCSYKDSDYYQAVYNRELSNEEIGYIFEFQFNKQETKCLITADMEPIYRYSYQSVCYIYDNQSKTTTSLFDTNKTQLESFSPDGMNISFIWRNNLYVKNLELNDIFQVTFDGKMNHIINGAPDWVYEEEFKLVKGYEWSPDSKNIAFYRFDESDVGTHKLVKYDLLYPAVFEYKFPMAGKNNSRVSVHVYNMDTLGIKEIELNNTSDDYIPGIEWVNDSVLCITKLNRAQTKVELLLANIQNGVIKSIYNEQDDKYLTNIEDDYVTFTDNGEHFIIKSEKDGYRHFYLYTIKGTQICQLTKGNWDAMNLLGVDEKSNKIFYSSFEGSSIQQHVYSVHMDGTNKKCLTEIQGTNNTVLSSNYSFFINENSSSESPYYYSVHDSLGNYLYQLESNTDLKKRINEHEFIGKEFFQLPVSDSFSLDAFIIKPKYLEKNKKYPLLIYVYGGPASKSVMDEWDYYNPFFQMLCQKGYIIACIDNRGTENRGEEFRKSNFLQLGIIEAEDQITAAEYFSGLTFIDSSRIGIFGWSYGGFMSIMCLLKGAHIYKTGIAIAPITHWRFYDTIYTERYMKKPDENKAGYKNTSLFNYADSLKGNLYIAYGSVDDNVLPVNTLSFIKELIENGKQFNVSVYPDKNHSIYGGLTRYQLFKSISEYIFEKL